MFLVYKAVRKVEREAERYSIARYISSRQRNMIMSRRVRLQGILYGAVLVFLCITYMLVFAISSLDSSYVVDFLASIVLPLHGFWNALIYMTPLLRKIIKSRCELRQNVSNLIQDNQNMSTKVSWLTRLIMMFWIQKRTSKKPKGSSSQGVEVVQDKPKKGDYLEGGSDRVGVLNVNGKQEDQISHINGSSELKGRKVINFNVIKVEDSSAISSSSLMLSCVVLQFRIVVKTHSKKFKPKY